MAPLNAINPLDSLNKGPEIMFYVQKKKNSAQCTCNYCGVILRLMTNINVLVGWHKWTFNEIERENPRNNRTCWAKFTNATKAGKRHYTLGPIVVKQKKRIHFVSPSFRAGNVLLIAKHHQCNYCILYGNKKKTLRFKYNNIWICWSL